MRGVLTVHPIESLDHPELAPYRTMRRNEDHVRQRIFVAEGEKVVRRLLQSRFEVVSLLLPEKWVEAYEPLILAREDRGSFPIFTADKKVLEQLIGFSMYQGVLGVGRIPEQPSLDALLERCPRPWLLVAVEDLTNAENLGALVRNCAGFGVTALLVGETCSSPWLRRAVRGSMGAVFNLPVIQTACLGDTLVRLQRQVVRCVAAHPHTEERFLPRADLKGDCCLVFGSEGLGLSETLLNLCQEAVAVPMACGLDSLNVTSAAAVFLYEAARQQGRLIHKREASGAPSGE